MQVDFSSVTLDCIRVHITVTHNMMHLCIKVTLRASSAQDRAAIAVPSSS
jgi:hypothetical protein